MSIGIRCGYKVLTHDYRPPIQGGSPVWDGCTLPHDLQQVGLDTSEEECAAGWNYCADLAGALYLGGLWPAGRPSVAFEVQASLDAITRCSKRRASGLRLLRVAAEEEVAAAISSRSAEIFGAHAEEMAREQIAWRSALARPTTDAVAVEAGLRAALDARGLKVWKTKRFPSIKAARAAWDARDARAARDALSLLYAVRMRWIDCPYDLLTVGLRDAYAAGLGVAIPTAKAELGWEMGTE